MRRTRHVVLPVRSWQYVGLMVVSLACLTLGLISRDRGGRSGSLGGSELMHTAPHEVDACPNKNPFVPVFPYDDQAQEKGFNDYTEGREEEAKSGAKSGRLSLSNDRAIDTGDRTRRIEPSRARIDASVSRIRSRVLGVRDKANSLVREKREILDRSRFARTDRRTLESSRSRGRFSDRTHGSRSFVFPESSSSSVRSESSDRYRRSSSVERRNRETAVSRDVSTRSRQQVPPQDRRTNGRRQDQSLDRRIADSDRGDRSRSIAGRTIRSMRDNQRSTERVRALVQEDRSRSEPTRARSSGLDRIDTARAEIRLQGRRFVDRTELNERENRRRLGHRSEKQRNDVRRSLSEDLDRVDARRMELRARRVSRSENQRREPSTRATTARDSPRHNSEPINVSRMRVRSDDRRSSGINGERVWIDSLRRDVRKNGNSERKERSAGRDVSREVERYERRRTLSMRSLPKERQLERRERLDIRHVSERRRQEPSERSMAREYGKTASREFPQASRRNSEQERRVESTRVTRILDSERSGRLTREVKKSREIRETSALRDSRRTSERNSMRRDVPISRVSRATSLQDLRRSADRILTRELRTSGERRETSNLRDSRRTAERNSLQRDVLASRVSRATRSERTGRSADRILTRELRTSGERRETSNLRDSRRTAERNSLQRDVLASRVSRATGSERTGRSADRILTRELRTSGERRETSNLRDSRRTAERNSLQRDVPVSRSSRATSPQDLRRSADRVLTRELGRSVERRETSNLKDSRRTTERNALDNDIRRARVSRIATSDRRDYRLARDYRERNTERRARSTVRIERDQTSRLTSLLPDARASRISRNPDVERNERDVSQERRVSRGQIDVARSERRIKEETRAARDARNRRIMSEPSRMNFRTMSSFANIEKLSSVKTNDYLHQTLVLVLCVIYGASLLRGKGGFYSFRNILNPVNRFVLW